MKNNLIIVSFVIILSLIYSKYENIKLSITCFAISALIIIILKKKGKL